MSQKFNEPATTTHAIPCRSADVATTREAAHCDRRALAVKHALLVDELKAYRQANIDCGDHETATDIAGILRLVGVEVAR